MVGCAGGHRRGGVTLIRPLGGLRWTSGRFCLPVEFLAESRDQTGVRIGAACEPPPKSTEVHRAAPPGTR